METPHIVRNHPKLSCISNALATIFWVLAFANLMLVSSIFNEFFFQLFHFINLSPNFPNHLVLFKHFYLEFIPNFLNIFENLMENGRNQTFFKMLRKLIKSNFVIELHVNLHRWCGSTWQRVEINTIYWILYWQCVKLCKKL